MNERIRDERVKGASFWGRPVMIGGEPGYLHAVSSDDDSPEQTGYDVRCIPCWLHMPHTQNKHLSYTLGR